MECKEVQEYISAAIDGEIESSITPHLNQHLQACPKCRNEFELERITKQLVKVNVRRAAVPPALANLITSQLATETSKSIKQKPWLMNGFSIPRWKTAVAVTSVLAIVLILIFIPTKSQHSHAQPNDDSLIHQTYNKFDEVLSGKMRPQVASSDPAVVRAALVSQARFDVAVPRLKRCTLIGGSSSPYKNQQLAHVVYEHGGEKIYLYQVRRSAVMEDHVISLPPEVLRELERTGWNIESHQPDCSLIIWLIDSTVCCAVADINKNQLLAFFKEPE